VVVQAVAGAAGATLAVAEVMAMVSMIPNWPDRGRAVVAVLMLAGAGGEGSIGSVQADLGRIGLGQSQSLGMDLSWTGLEGRHWAGGLRMLLGRCISLGGELGWPRSKQYMRPRLKQYSGVKPEQDWPMTNQLLPSRVGSHAAWWGRRPGLNRGCHAGSRVGSSLKAAARVGGSSGGRWCQGANALEQKPVVGPLPHTGLNTLNTLSPWAPITINSLTTRNA
jgi:hypothetical protein